MEEPTAAAAPSVARRPRKVERSCLLCHRRKSRCDKRSPCSTCVRTGVLCCYPTAEQPARKPRKTTIADVAERLGRLERTLVAISSDNSPLQGTTVYDGTTAGSGSPELDQPLDVDEDAGEAASLPAALLLRGGNSNGYYVDELVFSRILEEEQDIMSTLGVKDSPNDGDETPTRLEPFGLVGILPGASSARLEAEELKPSKRQAIQLWQIFLNNIEPFSKVLHLPTDEVTVFRALQSPEEVSADANCLLFAIYFAAMTSMTENEVSSLLGRDKMSALRACKRGLELSLSQTNFMEDPTFVALQAMCLFLQSFRAHNTGRSIWILAGLILRAAQSLGLHRDGKHLGLSPFEAEMRRRLWWIILCQDIRAAEDHGITASSHGSPSDISLPLNVNDGELFPNMKELPQPQPRWSEMTFPLILHEVGLARSRLYRMLPPWSSTVPSEAARREVVDDVTRRIEETYFRYHNPDIPVQRVGMAMGRIVLSKLDLVSKLQWLTLANKNGTRGLQATEEMFAAACQILEYGIEVREDDLLGNYSWVVEIYPQYHALLYALWHLCAKPVGPNVDRAWAAITASFDHVFMTQTFGDFDQTGSKWAVLGLLREKAERIRSLGGKTVQVASKGDPDEVSPATTNKMQWTAHQHEDLATGATENDLNWNMDDQGPPDWQALVANLGMEGGDFTNFLQDSTL